MKRLIQAADRSIDEAIQVMYNDIMNGEFKNDWDYIKDQLKVEEEMHPSVKKALDALSNGTYDVNWDYLNDKPKEEKIMNPEVERQLNELYDRFYKKAAGPQKYRLNTKLEGMGFKCPNGTWANSSPYWIKGNIKVQRNTSPSGTTLTLYVDEAIIGTYSIGIKDTATRMSEIERFESDLNVANATQQNTSSLGRKDYRR